MLCIRNGTFTLSIVLMVFSFLGMLYCAKKQKVYAYAQPIAITLLVVILCCMVIILTKTMGSGDIARIIENEITYAKAGAFVMGQRIAEKYPKRTALVIASKDWEQNRRTTEIIDALKKGMGDKVTIKKIDYPKVPPPKIKDPSMPEEDMLYMMEDMVQAEHYNELIDENKDCNLLIFLAPLPNDMVNMNIWEMNKEQRPMVALLFSDAFSLQRAIKAGYIICLSYKPGVKFDEEDPPSDPKAAFDKRYIIISPENVDEIAKEFKGYFQEFK